MIGANRFPPQKVFYDGQIYDAFDQMKKFVLMAKSELIVIDPYFDDSVLPLIAQKRPGETSSAIRKRPSRSLPYCTESSSAIVFSSRSMLQRRTVTM